MARDFTLATIGPELRALALEHEAATRKGLHDAAHEGRNRVVEEIRTNRGPDGTPRPVVDTGELVRSFTVTRIPDGAVLESVAPQAAIQEHGTKPYTPPFDPLLAWARRKLRGGKVRKKRKPGTRSLQKAKVKRQRRPEAGLEASRLARERQREEAAQALARRAWVSIRRYGIRPKRYYSRASEDFGEITEKAVLRRILKVL